MILRPRQYVQLLTTPDELRGMADRLDALWAKAKLGEEVPTIIEDNGSVVVRFTIDQERKYEEERRAKEKK